MMSARNAINVLSSEVVIACGMGAGTASEIALALKAKKHVVLLNNNKESKIFFIDLNPDYIHIANSPEEAIQIVKSLL
jgi:predicted Rossmann-fold nucleotide-binding protein